MFCKLILEQIVREVGKELSKNKLKHFRVLKEMTQDELAKEVNVSSDYISMLERGKRTPGFALANKIASVLGCTIDELKFF